MSEIDPVGIVVVYSMILCTITIQGIQKGGVLKLWLRLRYLVLVLDITCISWKYPSSVDLICISWIYLYFVDIIWILLKYPCSVIIFWILWKYPRSVDIIHISLIYKNFVDIIRIDHIMIYLARTVFPIFYIYSSSESDWCITSFFVFI